MAVQRSWILLAALGSLSACTPSPSPSASAAGAASANLYDGNCAPCHQQNGQGIPGVYPSLSASPVVLGDPRALARWVIKGARPASMPAGRTQSAMPQFGWLKETDAAALFTFLRSNFGNHGPAVEPADVAAALDN